MDEGDREARRLAEEDLVQERVDQAGNAWRKVYFGGGTHFQNWLEQTTELCGKDNVYVEEADATGLQCYEQGQEKMYRIWVRKSADLEDLT